MTADYRYHGTPGWNPAAGLPPDPPSLGTLQIAELARVSRKTAWAWAQKPGFPRPLGRRRAWPEEAVMAWLRSRNLVSGRVRGG